MDEINKVWPKWETVELIGQGGFGKVYKVKKVIFDQTFTYGAVKVIHIPEDKSELSEMTTAGLSNNEVKQYFYEQTQNLLNEIYAMEKLKSASHIVNIEDAEVLENQDSIGWTIYIRMELLEGLEQFLKERIVTPEIVIDIGIDICTALEFCHTENIIHRDIKPSNIFVSKNGEYKLGDFGIARSIERTYSTLSQKGTKSYMAPEIIKMEKYGKTVDIYALGLTMYEVINHGRMPFLPERFRPSDREEAMYRRLSGEKVPYPAEAGKELGSIICKACEANPQKRYQSAKELKQDLINIKKSSVIETDNKNPERKWFVEAGEDDISNNVSTTTDKTLGFDYEKKHDDGVKKENNYTIKPPVPVDKKKEKLEKESIVSSLTNKIIRHHEKQQKEKFKIHDIKTILAHQTKWNKFFYQFQIFSSLAVIFGILCSFQVEGVINARFIRNNLIIGIVCLLGVLTGTILVCSSILSRYDTRKIISRFTVGSTFIALSCICEYAWIIYYYVPFLSYKVRKTEIEFLDSFIVAIFSMYVIYLSYTGFLLQKQNHSGKEKVQKNNYSCKVMLCISACVFTITLWNLPVLIKENQFLYNPNHKIMLYVGCFLNLLFCVCFYMIIMNKKHMYLYAIGIISAVPFMLNNTIGPIWKTYVIIFWFFIISLYGDEIIKKKNISVEQKKKISTFYCTVLPVFLVTTFLSGAYFADKEKNLWILTLAVLLMQIYNLYVSKIWLKYVKLLINEALIYVSIFGLVIALFACDYSYVSTFDTAKKIFSLCDISSSLDCSMASWAFNYMISYPITTVLFQIQRKKISIGLSSWTLLIIFTLLAILLSS